MRLSSLEELRSIADKLDVKVYRRATNKSDNISGIMSMAWSYCSIDPDTLDWATERYKPFDQYYILLTDCLLALASKKSV